jgi:hypothetical protein
MEAGPKPDFRFPIALLILPPGRTRWPDLLRARKLFEKGAAPEGRALVEPI